MATKQQREVSTNNFILIVILVSLVAIVATVFIGRLLVNRYLLNAKVIDKKTVASNQSRANVEALSALELNYQALGPTKQVIDNSLPANADFPGLVSINEFMAGISGLRLQSIAVDDTAASPAPTPTGGAQTVVYNFTVSGSYAGLLTLVNNLQQSARPIRVVSMSLAGSNTAATATISAETYWQADKVLETKTEVVK